MCRLPQDQVPELASEEEARAWAKSQTAIHSARKAHIANKLAWKTKYYQFSELIELYAKWQQPRAPNTYKSNVYYLEQWIFPFFLNEKSSNNVNNWHLYLQEFVDWLQTDDALVKKRRTTKLAASTVNNIVKTLNTFLACLVSYHKIDPDSVRKAPTLPEHTLNRRTFADVILEPEMRNVHAKMSELFMPAADFFLVLWHTGMRFSELFGLPMSGLFKGDVPSKPLHDELRKCGIDYVGYIYLESQPENDDKRREADGTIKRKPLKSSKTISPKNARIIPIRTKEVWNVLALRYRAQQEMLLAKQFGADKINYMLFEDLSWNRANLTLQKTYAALKLEMKPYHCCRHTFTTLLVGETRSFFLTRSITGHKKDKSFERYLHIFERLGIEAQQNEQEIDVI